MRSPKSPYPGHPTLRAEPQQQLSAPFHAPSTTRAGRPSPDARFTKAKRKPATGGRGQAGPDPGQPARRQRRVSRRGSERAREQVHPLDAGGAGPEGILAARAHLASPRLASPRPYRSGAGAGASKSALSCRSGRCSPFVATGLERDRPAHRWRRSLSCRERLRWRSGTGCAGPPSARCGRAPWRACGACSDSASVPSESRAWRGGWPRSARSVPGSGGR